MKSPFPGMDPFIESQQWRDFHTTYIVKLRADLRRSLPDGYVAGVETDIVIVDDGGWSRPRVADVAVWDSGGGAAVAAAGTAVSPFATTFPPSDERRYHRIEVADSESGEVVTVVELLSPENKRSASDRHAAKRAEILDASRTSLVKLDLLRRGRRPRTVDPLPDCDCAAFVYEAWRRPRVEVYPWRLLDRMPAVPVPLREGEPPPAIDLQRAFGAAYEEAGFDRLLDYGRPCEPPLSEAATHVLAQ